MKTTIHLDGEYRRPEWEAWMRELPDRMAELPPSQFLRTGRNRVFRLEHLGRTFVVKHFRNTGAWKKVAYRIASGKARRSFEHSIALRDADVPCPEPVGWREDWKRGFLRESYFVSAGVAVAYTARDLRGGDGRERTAQVEAIARNIARMHDAGIRHCDLTPGNILFVDGGRAEPEICFIDNNRMRFGRVGLRKGIASLVQPEIDGACEETYVTAYAGERGLDPQVCLDLYRRRSGRHKLKWRIKNATRPWRRKIGL